jgi:hypothetical protein
MPKRIALAAACTILCLSAACTTTTTAPAQPHVGGEWHLDPAASEAPDSKIAPALAEAESKLRKRLVNAGFDQYDGGGSTNGHRRRGGTSGGDTTNSGAQLNGDEFSATGYIGPDFAGLRARLRQVLSPPRVLSIEVQPDSVRLTGDNIPSRDYSPGDDFTRIDEYGTARIGTWWDGDAFVLRAKYDSHATVLERYAADERAGTLTVTRKVVDPIAGKIAVRAIYRR